MDDRPLADKARANRVQRIRRARESVGAFIEFAFRAERDGSVVRNAPFHEEWQRLLKQYDKLVLFAPVEHAKTSQITVGYVLHRLGMDPNLRCAIVSNTSALAAKPLRGIKRHVEANPRVRAVFPGIKPSRRRDDPWTESAITVERETIARDPSIQACGVFGAINGSRLDLIVLDDICNFANTRTSQQRKKLMDWIDAEVLQRATAGAVVVVVGTPWHPEDALHELAGREGFHFARYSAVENPEDDPRLWRPIWPAEWPVERLLERKRTTTDSAFNRKLLTRVTSDETARFKASWLERMVALGRGQSFRLDAPWNAAGMQRLPCFTGVDLGVGEDEGHDLTVLFTIAIDERGRRVVVHIESGRWTAPDIVERLAQTQKRYNSLIAVESNAAQKYLIQFARGRIRDIRGLYTTAANKHDESWGVESLAMEMRNGLWVLPSGESGKALHEEAKTWLSGLRHYTPKGHTPDHVMASWIAREQARLYGVSTVQHVPGGASYR